MSQLSPVLRKAEGGMLLFWCPGCNQAHGITVNGQGRPLWTWNGDADNPTFAPSVLVRTGHYASHFKDGVDSCWCTYNSEHPDEPAGFSCKICHSFVRKGQIEFLSDCTHALAGRTVPLPEFPRGEP
jgi:hypothetical protein